MFNIGKLLSNPPKFTIEKNVKNVFNNVENKCKKHFNDSINEYSLNKYNNLLIKINEEHKKKQEIKNILYGNKQIIRSSNHSVIDLINNFK